ncbi:MAG: N-6 DNA methylase [Thermoflexales bacterium]|nr:N-6 DNA methylase [Thermoflexales bacterium]
MRVPVLQALFEQLSLPSKLKPLDLIEVMDWTAGALDRVDRAEFFARFEEVYAVQYFYEPFLQAFDPELRKELGVWYTPPEIVQYMVARVDAVLRTELGIEDGLADPRVYVLDPVCGTGAYAVEVLRCIAATLREKGEDALVGAEVKRAAIERIFGFEILPAPFVIAHLQIGLLLQTLGAPLSEKKNERAAIFLTNALTGWGATAEHPKQHLIWPEMEAERDAAERIKRDVPILVIMGNPPYNAFAGISPVEEQGMVEPYKQGLTSEWGIKKFNLDDLYIRFFRLAERRIAEMTGKGVVCYISNFSYLSDPSFVVMRQRFLAGFDSMWFDCMNGDSRETGKLTPDGKPDPSVFSTEYNREGIRVGTAIGMMVRKAKRDTPPTVRFRPFWGVTKRADLLASLDAQDLDARYQLANPNKSNRFSFRPSDVAEHYLEWPKLTELGAGPPNNGLMEKRGGALIDIDQATLEKRMRMYYDTSVSWDALKALGTGLTEDAAGYEAKKVRPKVQVAEKFQPERIRHYALRPFETRWCYYSDVSPLWNRSRPTLWAQCWEGNSFLMTRPAGVASPEGIPFYFTHLLGDNDFLRGHAYYFPLRLRPVPEKKKGMAQAMLFAADAAPTANLSPAARAYLAVLGITDPDADAGTASLIWLHALAIGYSPAYLAENADGIRQDWPRVPLPDNQDALLASAQLGQQIAALLDTETPVSGVTSGKIRPELKTIAVATRIGGGNIDPDAGELSVTAGWGHADKGGVTMPGKGKIVGTPLPALALSEAEGLVEGLGDEGYDIYLNDVVYWKNIPAKVWDYTIGGYQVIKKWLSYREHELLGRALTLDEVREVTNMARRIGAIILLEPALDENYTRIKSSAYAWPKEL